MLLLFPIELNLILIVWALFVWLSSRSATGSVPVATADAAAANDAAAAVDAAAAGDAAVGFDASDDMINNDPALSGRWGELFHWVWVCLVWYDA